MYESRQLIDDLDRRILRVLRDRPRASMSEQAAAVGVSRATLKTRLDRLWDTGIIIGRETQLDLASLGFGVQAWVEISVQQSDIAEVAAYLDAMPHVIEAFSSTGQGDVQCRVAARDTLHLQDVLLHISKCPQVLNTESSVILSSLVSHRKVQALDLLDL